MVPLVAVTIQHALHAAAGTWCTPPTGQTASEGGPPQYVTPAPKSGWERQQITLGDWVGCVCHAAEDWTQASSPPRHRQLQQTAGAAPVRTWDMSGRVSCSEPSPMLSSLSKKKSPELRRPPRLPAPPPRCSEAVRPMTGAAADGIAKGPSVPSITGPPAPSTVVSVVTSMAGTGSSSMPGVVVVVVVVVVVTLTGPASSGGDGRGGERPAKAPLGRATRAAEVAEGGWVSCPAMSPMCTCHRLVLLAPSCCWWPCRWVGCPFKLRGPRNAPRPRC